MTTTKKIEIKLKPCPFCRAKASDKHLNEGCGISWVECAGKACRAEGPVLKAALRAAKAWNRRRP